MEKLMAKTKWEKVLSESYVATNADISENDAEKELINCEFTIKQLSHEKENDQQLNAAKEIVKDLNAGYSSAMKYEKAKIEFLLEKIENLRIAKKAAGGQ
jgi:hypothetical protein